MKPGSAVEMPGGGRRWKTLVSCCRELYLDIEFPTVVHRPWKSLRDFHIPTAPTSLHSRSETEPKNPKKGARMAPVPVNPSGSFFD